MQLVYQYNIQGYVYTVNVLSKPESESMSRNGSLKATSHLAPYSFITPACMFSGTTSFCGSFWRLRETSFAYQCLNLRSPSQLC